MYPAISESRAEEANGDNVVSRENKRHEWAGKRVRKQQLVHGKDTGEMRVQNLGKDCKCWRLSKDPWADSDQGCFEADSGYKAGKTLEWSKLNGNSGKAELLLSVTASRIYQFATLHSNRMSM